MSRIRINKNKEKIVNLLNENIDLEYKLLVKSMKKVYDKEMDIGSKKEPRKAIVTFGMWYEWFKDEDRPNEKGVRIERNMAIAVDGKPSNYYRPLQYYTVNDI